MMIAKEDLQYVRQYIAEHGVEMTPDEVLEILREVKEIEVVDKPGLVTLIKNAKSDP